MWHQKSAKEVIREFSTNDTSGLTQEEIKRRLAQYGPNTLPTKKKPSLFIKFLSQFKSFLIIILIAATFISFLVGEYIDAIAIFSIVFLNAIIGFIQELQAEKTLESLKQKEIQYALVLREKNLEKVPITEIVPGDILILEEGEKIPADARLIESFSLRVDESVLTGESQAANKNADKLSGENIPLADRSNMLYKETKVLAGRGKAIVTATGKETEIGKIATFLKEAKPVKTPLLIELDKLARTLTFAVCFIAFLMFFINIFRNVTFVESLLISISLSVAAIPEGLPAIVTIVLSLGVKRLAEKKTIVKKLVATETLGAVRIIATDKTGTLTQNKINVVSIILPNGKKYKVEGEGFEKEGIFFDEKEKIINPLKNPNLEMLLTAGALANNAVFPKTLGEDEPIGDTTDAALLVAAYRGKIPVDEIRQSEPRIYEVPFTSERKMMSVITKINETGDHLLYSKGAPEVILERCSLTPKEKKMFFLFTQKMAALGLRSLAVGRRKINKKEVKEALENESVSEKNLEFLGILLMHDPLRSEVKEAISKASSAGIRTIMITGDHKETAKTIALQAGIIKGKEKIFTEDEINSLAKEELAKEIKNGVNVFARISPLGKLKIVEAIKSLPHMLVAVTGDGVNDAPALQTAHIGVAMGKSGTDITREVADIVITDDNYATIVDAVKEGRTIFANLVKFIRYLISCNLSEVIVIAASVIFATPLPLMPIQILWINLITDGLPALALGVDRPEFDTMAKPPRDLSIPIIHKTRWAYMLIEGTFIGLIVFFLFIVSIKMSNYFVAQTMTFSALAFSQLVHAFNNRSTRNSLFKIGIFSNPYLIIAAIISVILQVAIVQTNFGNLIFKTEKLGINNWIIVAVVSFLPFFFVEIKKKLRFKILP